MGFWKKSKYKKHDNYWFEEPGYDPNSIHDTSQDYAGWQGANYGGYTSYYKPKYDMSFSLETRVTQLIKTITGKSLRVAQAYGWGNDDEFFYYNPEDLQNATDDEVLGRIMQQLAKELFVDKLAVAKKNNDEPDYRHLLDSLEANRADKQLAVRYLGTRYYASELWGARKFTDNPLNNHPQQLGFVEWYKVNYGSVKFNGFSKADRQAIEAQHAEYLKYAKSAVNPAWEFCFNIHALQNGESDFDFTDDKVADNFSKALPFISTYLNATSFEEALKVYPTIQKYYPIPNKQQQQQMDGGMGKTQGLTQHQMAAMKKQLNEDAKQQAKRGGQNGEDDFLQAFAGADRRGGVWDEGKQGIATYKKYLQEYQGVANVLHSLIRSILKDNAVKRYVRPFKRGKIDGRSMYKYLATDNLRIFKRPRAINKKDYLMAIGIDMSSSMTDNKASTYACKGAIIMADVLERLGFPYEVIAYNGKVYPIKQFNRPLRKGLLPVLEFADGGTNDIDALEQLTKHVANYDGGNHYKKSIFWITDGQSTDAKRVKDMTTKLEREHNAVLFAIGIGNSISASHLKAAYNTYLKVDDIAQLPKELANLMRSQFRRG